MDLLIALLNAGLLTPVDALAVLDAQREQHKPIGRLALESRLLTVRQVFLVLTRTADSGERFGEAAIGLGLLTPEHIATLLLAQERPISELLIELDLCDIQTLERLQRVA